VTNKKFKFAETHELPFYFVSAADGTNVVKVFSEAVQAGVKFKKDGGDFMTDVLELLGESSEFFFFFFLDLCLTYIRYWSLRCCCL
jgi:Rab-like protein 2